MKAMTDRTLTIEKIFDAPVKLVWNAWTTPEQIVKWWAPPGMEVKVLQHEFKEGGSWKYAMPMPDGSEFISAGVYQEIIEMKKIVTTADFKPMTEGVELHVLFEDLGKQTKFSFSVIHATADYCQQQKEMGFYNGWGSAFDRLEKSLSS
ncbi:SRPBCC family protein [Nonlabens xiamenensis]|uniref:SRPBCC family protein n=1 Tax=Nonlabens xiamenensis TaxID=2341043 RepID=UPI000F60D45E|nr:SRPBCC domain-containing protein [Nonlabens xiamenensis]